MWLFYALLGPPFWALVHILDSHCVGNVFEKPWMGVITSSLATAALAMLSLTLLPWEGFSLPEWYVVALGMLAGVFIQIAQACYFQALEKTEAGIVAAYGNFTPTLLPLASYFLMGDILQYWQYISIGVLVIASICFCLIDVSRNGNWKSIILMLLASTLQVAAILTEKHVFTHCDFAIGFSFVIVGIVLSGTLPLLVVTKVRRAFRRNLPKLKPLAPLFLGIELANLIALYLSQKAVDLGSPTLAAAMETTVPGYTFVLTILLMALKPKLGSCEVKYKLRTKLILVGIMTAGVMQIA